MDDRLWHVSSLSCTAGVRVLGRGFLLRWAYNTLWTSSIHTEQMHFIELETGYSRHGIYITSTVTFIHPSTLCFALLHLASFASIHQAELFFGYTSLQTVIAILDDMTLQPIISTTTYFPPLPIKIKGRQHAHAQRINLLEYILNS